MKKNMLLAFTLVLVFSVPAFAHFQMIYTPETILDKGGTVNMKLVFTHPFEAGHTMEMDKPLEFFVVNKEKKTDLLGSLKPITWKSLENSAKA